MKKLIVSSTWFCLVLFIGVACKNSPRENYTPPPKGAPVISVSNVEIQPNPFHLWPDPNYKLSSGQYRVVVTVTNTGNEVCSSKLFFTLYATKADQYGNYKSKEFSLGGATLEEQMLPNEKMYVVIPIDSWVVLETANGDFDSIVGSYKTRVEVQTNEGVAIDKNQSPSMFQIVKGG
ncbi:MAG TPA: hypothetical protein VFZ42_09975 [Chitinophagaceae bacterium]